MSENVLKACDKLGKTIGKYLQYIKQKNQNIQF